MRDIREDLEERARVLELQMGGMNAFFEQQVEQLKKERDIRLAELKSELEAVNRVLKLERQRVGQPIPQEPARTKLGCGGMQLNGNGRALAQPS